MLQIKNFDMNKIFAPRHKWGHPTYRIAIIGRRSTGKTTLVCDILRHSGIKYTVVITEQGKEQYEKLGDIVFDTYRDNIVENFLMKQRNILNQYKAYHDMDPMSMDPRSTIVFDTYDGINETGRNKLTHRLFMNAPCERIMLITSIHHPSTLSQYETANCDYFFIFKEAYLPNRKILYERFGSMFPTFDAFCSVFDQICGEDYTCMVISLRAKSGKFQDMVFWYKAEI